MVVLEEGLVYIRTIVPSPVTTGMSERNKVVVPNGVVASAMNC